jgi:hypothetical protein
LGLALGFLLWDIIERRIGEASTYGYGLDQRDFWEMVGIGWLHGWALDWTTSKLGYDLQNYAADVYSSKRWLCYIHLSKIFLIYAV